MVVSTQTHSFLNNIFSKMCAKPKKSPLCFQAVYELANSSHPIANYVKSSLIIIEEAIQTYGLTSVGLSFNGGKDCTVLLHLYCAVLAKLRNFESTDAKIVPTLYIETPLPFGEIEDFVRNSESLYGIELYRVQGPMKIGLSHYLRDYPQVKAVLIGSRSTDPYGEYLTVNSPTSEGWPDVMRVHPVLNWSYHIVWDFLRVLNVPYCTLYDIGFTSLGDKDNTLPNPLLKNSELVGGYEPAWKLQDETTERNGRISKIKKPVDQ